MTSILIVDDHPAMRLVLKNHLLQLLGVDEVIEADNGQCAIELVRLRMPELVLLDLDIPRSSGLDVAPRLRAIHPQIRILVVTALDPAVFVSRSWQAGAQGFVSKTQDLKEILRAVEAVLAGYTVFPAMGRDGAPRQAMSAERRRCGGCPTRNWWCCRCWRAACRTRPSVPASLSAARPSAATRPGSWPSCRCRRWWNWWTLRAGAG